MTMQQNSYTIFYKSLTPLVKLFCQEFQYEKYQPPTLSQKWGFGKEIKNPDIYFHNGIVKQSEIELMKISSLIIVNSNTIKHNIVEKSNSLIKNDKIYVISPGHDINRFKKKEFKKVFINRHNLDKNIKLIYFTAQNYEKSGLMIFLSFITKLESTNFKALISGTSEQLKPLVPLLKELEIFDYVILVKANMFRVADIFVLPTQNKVFSLNVLKAMASKCAVFVPQSNHIFEILDNFSIMNRFDDITTIHKIDMLLENTQELKNIQKQNYKKSKEYMINKQYTKLKLALNS
jgi:glycosyltransferase involved in cell wall biosynthesis